MYPAQRRGLRATVFHDLVPLHHPEWCTPRTVSMHTSKAHAAVASCDVVFANSSYTAADLVETLRFDPARIVVAYPGLGPGLDAGGAARRPRRPHHPRARDDRAAEEHRPPGRGVAAARRRARPGARRRRGLGRSARSRRPTHPEARLRPRGGGRLALPWVGGVRLPVALRGVRDPGDRGDGLRRAGGGVRTSLARRGVRGRGGAGRSARRGRDRGRRATRRSAAATSSSRSASGTQRDSRGARTGRVMLEALEERA